MTAPVPRRAFLRGLITLPLVGGAIELAGNPRAVAMPVTNQLMHEYIDWLGWERQGAIREMYAGDMAKLERRFGAGLIGKEGAARFLRQQEGMHCLCTHAYDWHHGDVPAPQPSTRAALVLSAVGSDWRGPYDF